MAHPLTEIQSFNYQVLNKELELTAAEKAVFDVIWAAYLNDFWQKGHGSLLPPATGARSGDINNLFQKRFVFRNVLRECTARVAGAFFAKAPNWRYEEGQTELDRSSLEDLDTALSEVWTKQRLPEVISQAFESRLAVGRGGLRIFIPLKYKRQASTTEASEESKDYVQFPSVIDALKAMRVEFIPPTQSKLLDDGGDWFSIVKYAMRKNWSTNDVENVIEFSFVDDSDMTFIGTIAETEGVSSLDAANLSSGFDLSGYPTFMEFKGLPYITPGMYRNNQLMNLALTCAGFSLVDNGFGEMTLTNVQLETETVVGPDGAKLEVPKQIRRGGGVVNNFVGIEEVDENGTITRATPQVNFREPSSIQVFKDGRDMAYMSCLEEASQLYALISGDATASGESRIQALADFLLRISKYKSEVDEIGSWLLTVMVKWASQLSGQEVQNFNVVFDSRVHVANLSSDEKTTVMAMRKDGVISRETERILLGIDDPVLEEELILKESVTPITETTMEDFSERLDVGQKMLMLGIDTTEIQRYLGYTAEQIIAMEAIAAERQAVIDAQINAASGGPVGPTPQETAAAQGQ